jgi:2-amino-4-hydroxy-6-hydroxymethyldihydropteridine diphosphokinase
VDLNILYVLTGSNLGDRERFLAEARRATEQRIGRLTGTSSLYETAAWGNTGQPPFLNQVIRLESRLSAEEVLAELIAIERELGRERRERWAPRTVDLDLLFFNAEVIKHDGLEVPHPRLHLRRFTLAPLNELAPDLVHPVLGRSMKELLERVEDPLSVRIFAPEQS